MRGKTVAVIGNAASAVQFVPVVAGQAGKLLIFQRSASTLEVREDVEERYNQTIQARLQDMVWNSIADSWYKIGGRITNNWPGSAGEYRRVTRTFNAADFDLR